MKILITGATGGLGLRIIELLIDNINVKSILATGRTIKTTHYVDHDKVSYVLGNLEDENFSDFLVSQVDHIIHAAALSSPWGSRKDFEIANVKTTENLIKAAKAYNIKRFIFVSTPSIYFSFKNQFDVNEEEVLPRKFVNHYAATKRLAEIQVLNSDLPFVILRPRALIGRGDSVLMPRLIKAHKKGRLKIIGDGENLVDLTSLANVADAVELSLIVEGAGLNQIYNITNGQPVKLWSCINHVLKELGFQLNDNKVPYPVVMLVARLMEWKSLITNKKEPSITKYGVGVLANSFTMNISKAEKYLGYKPRVSTEEAILEFVKWHQENE